MDELTDTPTPSSSPLQELAREIESRSLPYELLGDTALRVFTGSSDVVMTVVPMLAEVTGPVGVLAENGDGASAVIMRSGRELFVIRRNPGTWEHFDAPGGPTAILGSWKNGERTRFRRRHGALWQAVPEARALADQLGLQDELPAEVPPPPPPPAPEKPVRGAGRTRTRAAGTRPSGTAGSRPSSKAASTAPAKKAAEVPPPPPLCPRCFTVLPLTGRCDCS